MAEAGEIQVAGQRQRNLAGGGLDQPLPTLMLLAVGDEGVLAVPQRGEDRLFVGAGEREPSVLARRTSDRG